MRHTLPLLIFISQGCNSTIRLICPCGFNALCNMSGGSDEGVEFDHLVNQNMMLNAIQPAEMNQFLTGINMKASNYQGNVVGVNLLEKRMSNMRNQLYCDIIQKKNDLEEEMLKAVLDQEEMPTFAIDGFYSNM